MHAIIVGLIAALIIVGGYCLINYWHAHPSRKERRRG